MCNIYYKIKKEVIYNIEIDRGRMDVFRDVFRKYISFVCVWALTKFKP